MTTQRPCKRPGCPNLVTSGYCNEHRQHERTARYAAFYRTTAWLRLRSWWLGHHPSCQWPGCVEPANTVDHIVPMHLGGSPWAANVQSLCPSHHTAKTFRIDPRLDESASPSLVRALMLSESYQSGE